MASHRKPRTGILQSVTAKRGAIGITTAALASVSLLSQSAQAAPDDGKPSMAEVKKKVDKLYQQAETSTQKYNAAKEKTDEQRKKADSSLDDAAERTEKLNDARRTLGNYRHRAVPQRRNVTDRHAAADGGPAAVLPADARAGPDDRPPEAGRHRFREAAKSAEANARQPPRSWTRSPNPRRP